MREEEFAKLERFCMAGEPGGYTCGDGAERVGGFGYWRFVARRFQHQPKGEEQALGVATQEE